MSGTSRKVKNPLLSAAGEGFPFENYAETAVLVPVTPATPAVLRDDAELDSFVGQEPIKSHNSTLSKASTDADSEFTPIPLISEENRTSTSQPAKQGYLTSILSSLPNLSLSSITGESPGSQASQTQQDASSVHNTNSYVPSHERGDSLRDTSPPIVANFHDPRRTYFTSSDEGRIGSNATLSAPSQPSLPPTVPSSSNGPISYRLGNQRRLKYAPPPDLTSNISKQHSTPVVLPPFATQSVETPTIFNPNEFGSSDQSYQSVPSPNPSSQSVPLTQSSPSILSTKTQQQVSSTQSLGLSTQSYQPIPSSQSFQSVPLIQSCQSVPSTKSNESVPSTESNQPVSLTASHQSVPVAQSLSPVRPTQSHPPVPAVQSHPSIQAVQSHPPGPTAQSNPPVLSTRSQHQSVLSTQSHQPIPSSQSYQPSTEDHKSTSSTQSYHSVPLIHSYQSGLFTQSNQTVLSTQSHQQVPPIQRYRPILSTQCHQPVPLTQSYQCVPLTQSSQSVPSPQSNYHVETSVISKSPSIQGSTSEYVSESNSVQESFRSSPLTTGVPQNSIDTSQRVSPQNKNPINESVLHFEKSHSSLSFGQPFASQLPEPSTPQNTPANVSFFGFDGYADQRDLPRTFNSEKQTAVVANKNSTRGDAVPENTVTRSTSETKPTVTFAPVSAVQVTEKLEHLLAEQKEYLSNEVSATKVVENKEDDQIVNDLTSVKLNDNENKGDSSGANIVKDAFTRQEASEPIRSILNPQEPTAAYERIDASQSNGVLSTVQPTLQYFQAQSLASSTDFFAEKPSTDQRSNLNLAHTQSASTFFNLSGIDSPFAGTQYQQNNTNADLTTTISSRHDLQQPPLTASVTSGLITSSTYTPCSIWGGKRASTLEAVDPTFSSSIQSSHPPLFYNPAQFQSESHRHSYGSPTLQPTANLSQTYFDNLSGAGHSQNTFGGVTSAFLPVSVAMTTVPEPTGSATLSPVQMSVNPLAGRNNTDSVPSSFQNLSGLSDRRMQYRAVYHHWFYRKEVEHKVLWLPFSMQDSLRLEEVHNSTEITPETTVATDGGRYDVDILRRQRSPVYWNGATTEVRRCSWFYKGPTESRYVPYDESTAAKLEEEYKQAYMSNKWNRRIDLNNGEYIVFHSATVQVHYLTPSSPELAASWGNSAGSEDSTYLQGAGTRPRVIKRGLDDFHIEDGEPEKVDHLLFLVHGIGSVCDLKFRSVEEVVDEFRSISLQLVQSHYRTASEQRIVNRIEVLPISWHTTLHSEDTGIDKKLQAITLESIPKLRHFTNDTLLDILFYTSPVYCQTIMQTVGSEVNRLYTLFKERNPDFNGGIYLGGHSLGSLILFDLLCHQKPSTDDKSSENNDESSEDQNNEETDPTQALPDRILKRRLSKKISYVIGAAGTGQPYIHYPQLIFHPRAFFAFGSPIGMFVTVRGIDMLGEDFILPTCPAFFNIFHPFDPVAYRVEALINPEAYKYRPMLIPHHKGRKRMHLELKETMARVGADLKQKVIDSVRNTWNSVYQLALFHRSDNSVLEREIDKVVEEQLQQTPTVSDQQSNDDGGAEFKVGKLNGGRRIDYVLQEAPFEYINEYIFALTSHVCYWESEDTMLLILKEMYGSTGIQTDAQLPQQTLSIERTSPSPSSISSTSTTTKCDVRSSIPVLGMDPTAPIAEKTVGPPPKAGFVRKS